MNSLRGRPAAISVNSDAHLPTPAESYEENLSVPRSPRTRIYKSKPTGFISVIEYKFHTH